MSDDLTLDDLTVVGIDGIRRSFDEHYDTMMCVEQDPTGAHHAILNQHARMEELEKQNASLEAKLNKLRAVSERALMLSLKYSHFKLHAMEPMHKAIAAAKIKGEQP